MSDMLLPIFVAFVHLMCAVTLSVTTSSVHAFLSLRYSGRRRPKIAAMFRIASCSLQCSLSDTSYWTAVTDKDTEQTIYNNFLCNCFFRTSVAKSTLRWSTRRF